MMADDERDDTDAPVDEEGLPDAEDAEEEETETTEGAGFDEFGNPIEE